MSGFGSDAAAYIVGILVGAVVAVALLGLLGWYYYRKLGIAHVEEGDEELQALRREASMYEDPNPADRDDPVLQPSASNVQENNTNESKKPVAMTAAVAASVKMKASNNRKMAWKF